jgi:hypothetical protein
VRTAPFGAVSQIPEVHMQRLVMVMRADRPEHTPEAEPMLVDDSTPGVLRLVLDDGVELSIAGATLVVADDLPQAVAA